MTKQQAFDKMVAHLAGQGRRSVDLAGPCLYRGPNGMKCVVGAMISDEVFKVLKNHGYIGTRVGVNHVWNVVKEELALEDTEEQEAKKFYSAMQHWHDISRSPEEMRWGLGEIATAYDLNDECVESIEKWTR